jgi:hypothetical protein
MRYRLRPLLILLAVAPPVIWGGICGLRWLKFACGPMPRQVRQELSAERAAQLNVGLGVNAEDAQADSN